MNKRLKEIESRAHHILLVADEDGWSTDDETRKLARDALAMLPAMRALQALGGPCRLCGGRVMKTAGASVARYAYEPSGQVAHELYCPLADFEDVPLVPVKPTEKEA